MPAQISEATKCKLNGLRSTVNMAFAVDTTKDAVVKSSGLHKSPGTLALRPGTKKVIRLPAPLSVQLFSLHNAVATDPFDVVSRLASMGFDGVEPFLTGPVSAAMTEWAKKEHGATSALPAVDVRALHRALDEHGLVARSCHVMLPDGDGFGKILDDQELLGSGYLVVPSVFNPETGGLEDFSDLDRIKRLAERFNVAAEQARTRSIRIGYHNHHWEFATHFSGRSGFEVFFDFVEPDVFAEIDVYWAQVGGRDPVELIRALGERVQLLHLKDGDGEADSASCDLGEGVVDLLGVMSAATSAAWHVVELEGLDENALWPMLERSRVWLTETI
jgi:sugar phosphate isomerase/epimerase